MHSLFPVFRARFIQEPAWCRDTCAQEPIDSASQESSAVEPLVRMAGCGPTAVRGPANFIRPLMLDLNTLPREDGPPSESVLKRQKFAVFEKHCSQVADGLYVSGEAVARDRAILAQHNISHVVNCVGALYPEYFKSDGIQYKTLWLQDHPQEDITCVLYDTFDFIEAARNGNSTAAAGRQQLQQQPQQRFGTRVPPLPLQQPQQQRLLQQQQQQLYAGGLSGSGAGRVLVHCSQGVSRSTTIAIAYLMWKTGGSYDEVYQAVRALRGVTSPNVGFMCQLINWAKRRQRPPTRVRLYRISPHCAESPLYLVPRAVSPRPGCSHPDWTQLDPRGCFVAHLPGKVYVWRGQQCMADMLEAGMQAAAQLSRYEGAPAAQAVRQGEEPEDLLAALTPAGSGSSTCCDTNSCCTRADSAAVSGDPSSNNLAGAAAAALQAGAAAAAAAAVGGWDGSSQQQQQQQEQQQQQLDMDADMTSAPTSAAGSRPSSAQQQQQQQQQQAIPLEEQQQQQQGSACDSQQAAVAAASNSPLTPSSSQLRTAGSASFAAAAAAGVGVGLGPSSSGRVASFSSPGSGPAAADAAAAAAAQVLLGVQLGPDGGLKALQQVQEYDADFELWCAALHRSSQPEGGRQTPRSPLTVAAGLWDEGGLGPSPRAGSPAAVEGRSKKYSRSDSEGRSVVPSCRQPGRLSTSSSQAWPDGGTPCTSGPGSIPGGMFSPGPGQAPGQAAGRQAPQEACCMPGMPASTVEMRQSSTVDQMS